MNITPRTLITALKSTLKTAFNLTVGVSAIAAAVFSYLALQDPDPKATARHTGDALKKQDEQTELQRGILDVLRTLPEGEKVRIGLDRLETLYKNSIAPVTRARPSQSAPTSIAPSVFGWRASKPAVPTPDAAATEAARRPIGAQDPFAPKN
jgi:hypothetical protein